ncbi:hypothetical protein PSACC_01857 [Paramicrosporidium saccamoebae]|uniref:Uncharacterized protein n=1 Tax=Paramicrosporidium saccamoebae TaxID=1246581 RepID=A0A2H9TKQ0_9FUNG|nr:hypothetical protein PSACC_01857 [Paramicrosporidium saccamoebae]
MMFLVLLLLLVPLEVHSCYYRSRFHIDYYPRWKRDWQHAMKGTTADSPEGLLRTFHRVFKVMVPVGDNPSIAKAHRAKFNLLQKVWKGCRRLLDNNAEEATQFVEELINSFLGNDRELQCLGTLTEPAFNHLQRPYQLLAEIYSEAPSNLHVQLHHGLLRLSRLFYSPDKNEREAVGKVFRMALSQSLGRMNVEETSRAGRRELREFGRMVEAIFNEYSEDATSVAVRPTEELFRIMAALIKWTGRTTLKSYFRQIYVDTIVPLVGRKYYGQLQESYEKTIKDIVGAAKKSAADYTFWTAITDRLIETTYRGTARLDEFSSRQRQNLLINMLQELLIVPHRYAQMIRLLMSHSRNDGSEREQHDLLLRISLTRFRKCFEEEDQTFFDEESRLLAVAEVFKQLYSWYLALPPNSDMEGAIVRAIMAWRKGPGEPSDRALQAQSAAVDERLGDAVSLTSRFSAMTLHSPGHGRRIRRIKRERMRGRARVVRRRVLIPKIRGLDGYEKVPKERV